MVDNNDSLFREVDEELRREQYAKLWDRYGIYVLSGAALIVAVVGGYKYWEVQKLASAQAAGTSFEAAIDLASSGKTDDSVKALATIAASGPKGYAALAELSLAAADLKAGKRGEALAAFEKLARDSRADRFLSGFAALQAAAIRLGEADFTEIQNRLKPLMGDDNPWHYLAKEYVGTAAVKAGKLAEARATLSPLLSDPLLPQSAAERIRRLMDTIATADLASAKAPAAAAPDQTQAPTPGDAKSAPVN
ncbi:MAG: tetratricopeptide repeat protein [Hyphomicrobium sp.]|jgi:hypothetical protein